MEGQKNGVAQRFCSCSISQKRTCEHTLELTRIYKELKKRLKGKNFDDDFRSSIWDEFAQILGENCKETLDSVHMDAFKAGEEYCLKISGSDGEEMFSYLSDGDDRAGFWNAAKKRPGAAPFPIGPRFLTD